MLDKTYYVQRAKANTSTALCNGADIYKTEDKEMY